MKNTPCPNLAAQTLTLQSPPDRRELLALHRQHHVPAQALYSYGKRELGDLYVWGSLVAGSPDDEEGAASAVRAGRGRWGNGADAVGGNWFRSLYMATINLFPGWGCDIIQH